MSRYDVSERRYLNLTGSKYECEDILKMLREPTQKLKLRMRQEITNKGTVKVVSAYLKLHFLDGVIIENADDELTELYRKEGFLVKKPIFGNYIRKIADYE